MGSYTLDRSRFPLVRLTVEGQLGDEQFVKMFDEIDAILYAAIKYGIVIDMSAAKPPTARQRAVIAERWKTNFDRAKQTCVAGAFVIRSALVRGALTAVTWLQTQPHPVKYVASYEVAERFVSDWLSRDKLDTPQSGVA